MTTGTYDRYGLTSNPFRDLASENLEDIEIYHVTLQVDRALATIKDEVAERENRALVALVGPLGSGKTQRLLLAATEARERKAFTVYFDITAKTSWVLRGLAEEFARSTVLGGLSRTFASPAWYRDVVALQHLKDQRYDANKAGKAIARALNENAPAFLLLNDLHNLQQTAEVDAFVKTLEEIGDSIRPGVLVMFGAYPNYLQALSKAHPSFASRINRTFALPALSAEEAGLLLAKKLLAKRLVEDLDPLYPFDPDAVAAINAAVAGNPRRLLEIADHVLEYAVAHRAYRVDVDLVQTVLAARTTAQAIVAVPPAGVRPPAAGATAVPIKASTSGVGALPREARSQG